MTITKDKLDWLIDVTVFMTPISHTNFNTNTSSTGAIRNATRDSSGAQNDSISFDVVLATGTWTVELLYRKNTDAGVYSVQFGGVEKGTIDGYAAASSYDNLSTVSGITLGVSGKIRLSLVMATKNASSSNYKGYLQHIQLRRTA